MSGQPGMNQRSNYAIAEHLMREAEIGGWREDDTIPGAFRRIPVEEQLAAASLANAAALLAVADAIYALRDGDTR